MDAERAPEWALRRAQEELFDVDDPEILLRRAHEIVRDEQQLADERHDEYDDPDEGGEG